MGLFDKLRKPGRQNTAGHQPQPISYTLTLNARLQPVHRGELYEDPLDEKLGRLGIGSVSGGATAMEEQGEIQRCTIEIVVYENGEAALNALLSVLGEMDMPKGSALSRGGDLVRKFGRLEGLALYLNGTGLPDVVYQTCDINEVISELGNLLGDFGRLFSWWEGSENTVLYFYGESFADMSKRMEPFLSEYPLCQNCRTEQIA